jgi:hypothetical protein
MTDSPDDDIEQRAATALLRACADLLAAQRVAQPGNARAIADAVAAAPELRVEVTLMLGAPRSAAVRLVALDGQGDETMLIRALGMTPPARGPLQ